jgi:NADPH-dependent curcumin reductase CurA
MKKILLVSRPKEEPQLENFKVVEDKVPPSSGNDVLVKTLYLSVDPYMRGRMNEEESYVPPFKLNDVVYGGGIGQVQESKNSEFSKGDLVFSVFDFPWQDYARFSGENLKNLKKLDKGIEHPSYALSVLGMPGLTAYFGFTDICQPKEGETLLVTGAAGAVGSLVGQIGKILGCKAIGIAGSQEKIKTLKDLGFDDAIDYKKEQNLSEAIKRACPKGIDCFYDNVGGPVMDAVMEILNLHAKVAFCGAISQYTGKNQTGPRHNWLMITKGISAKGFIIFRDYGNRFDEGLKQMEKWLKEGKLKMNETTVEGIENTPQAFVDLFSGKNVGKMVVRVSKPKASD